MKPILTQNIQPKITGARKRKMTYKKISAATSFNMQPALVTTGPMYLIQGRCYVEVRPNQTEERIAEGQQVANMENEESCAPTQELKEVKKEPIEEKDYPSPVYSYNHLLEIPKTESRSTEDSDRDTASPDSKRERNKWAVQRHRKKLNEYLETAPKNIRNMEQIEKELDRSIEETESHIKALETILVQLNCNSGERGW